MMVNVKNNSYIFIWSLLMLFVIGSCTDNFSGINTPSDERPLEDLNKSEVGQAFAQSQYQGVFGNPEHFQKANSLQGDVFVEYFATTQPYFNTDQYESVGAYNDKAWKHFYSDAAPQLDIVEKFTEENNMQLENTIAKVWRVAIYHRITDYWGPIIYSEFGTNENTVTYDSQKSIYNSFFKTLNETINVLKSNKDETAFSQDDLLFDGNLNKWLKFANSLKLRLAMRIRYVDPAKAKTEAEEAVNSANGGVMTTNADNATVKTTENNRNPYSTITDWGEFRMSAAIESALKGYEDPRMSEYFNPAEAGEGDSDGGAYSAYQGFRNGVPRGKKNQPALNALHSDMNTKYFNPNRGGSNPPIQVMNASEVYFLRAEGALLGWNMGGGTARSYYEEGIRTSMKNRTDATVSEITAYINSSNTPKKPEGIETTFEGAEVDYNYNLPPLSNVPIAFDNAGSQEFKLEQIITQKWIALYPNSWEAWAELRRTGYPRQYERVNSINPDVGAGEIIRRLVFASYEFTQNEKAVRSAQDMLEGGDKNSTRIWWDKKPISKYPNFVTPH